MPARTPPTAERLHKLLRYDAETGKLFWRERSREDFMSQRSFATFTTRFAGQEAFTASSYGYRAGRVDNVLFVAHRVIWVLVHGCWPVEDIDHINGDRADNRLANLRSASRSENLCNRALPAANTSGHKGVFLHQASGKWRAHIKKSGVLRHLGCFDTLEGALSARRSAEQHLHGEFARAA